ncbi:MAG: DUF1893 domain-containing protein [Alistipes sp.]|nr:DUF1893 domain-containing protein [Alistipes senegalensis]MCM1250371.1 DUF1893 domain-containing protein [Alistipes sp.]
MTIRQTVFPDDVRRQELIARLHAERCSCVIANGTQTRIFRERGVKDLYRLLTEEPASLAGAFVADKVVGKGAAALMILGKVREVYADVASTPALELFAARGVKVECALCVPQIINRAGTGPCPVETLCSDCRTPEECLEPIRNFLHTR